MKEHSKGRAEWLQVPKQNRSGSHPEKLKILQNWLKTYETYIEPRKIKLTLNYLDFTTKMKLTPFVVKVPRSRILDSEYNAAISAAVHSTDGITIPTHCAGSSAAPAFIDPTKNQTQPQRPPAREHPAGQGVHRIQSSCRGEPIPTHTKSGCASRIRRTTSASSLRRQSPIWRRFTPTTINPG